MKLSSLLICQAALAQALFTNLSVCMTGSMISSSGDVKHSSVEKSCEHVYPSICPVLEPLVLLPLPPFGVSKQAQCWQYPSQDHCSRCQPSCLFLHLMVISTSCRSSTLKAQLPFLTGARCPSAPLLCMCRFPTFASCCVAKGCPLIPQDCTLLARRCGNNRCGRRVRGCVRPGAYNSEVIGCPSHPFHAWFL